jgi:hypothetical protein
VETVPAVADQVTPVLLEPVTVAVNCCVLLVRIEVEGGEMATETTGDVLTVTVDDADFVLSAMVVAVTLNVPAVFGAV